MNALDQTAFGIASALTGRKRADQSVHVVCSVISHPNPTRHTVLVDGQYYEVRDRTLELLRDGMTPEYLELEPVDLDGDGVFAE